MANKLKPHVPKIIGAPVMRTTRLGKALRDLVADHPDLEFRIRGVAGNLDRTVMSLGTKGEAIKMLASYQVAAALYREVTGSEYAPPK